MEKDILIVHYNTPELTSALVKSINKTTSDVRIHIFDNSDKYPFINEFGNVSVIDNTEGQLIDFDKMLSEYHLRYMSGGSRNNWASAKHCYTIEWYVRNTDKPFLLMDSDVLVKKDLSPLFNDSYVYVGEVLRGVQNTSKSRVLPFMCYINTLVIKENNISYFSGDRMHGLNGHTDGDKYDTGASFYEDTLSLSHKDIRLDDYIIHFKAGSWNALPNLSNTKPADAWLSENRVLWDGNKEKNRKVVYTCITNGYDKLKDPKFVTEGFDYVCFTDDGELKNSIWQIRPMPTETDNIPSHKKQRFVKINPHVVLPEYELSIWVDANIMLTGDLNEFLNVMCKGDSNIYVPTHPVRNCIYEEMRICAAIGKDRIENMKPQIDRYRSEGFPQNYGLLQSNILVRRHNRRDCIRLMSAWWKELIMGSHRDQLSFNYASWKNGGVEVRYIDRNIYRSRWFDLLYKHDGDGIKPKKPFKRKKEVKKSNPFNDTERVSVDMKNVEIEEIKASENGKKDVKVYIGGSSIPKSIFVNENVFDKVRRIFEKSDIVKKDEKHEEPKLPDSPKVSNRINKTLRNRK